MPLTLILILGLVVFNSGVIDKVTNSNQETPTEIVASKVESKPAPEEVKPIPKQPEPIKEEVKV